MPTDRKAAIQQMPRPVTVRGVRKVLGLFNYSRSFIPDFAETGRAYTEASERREASIRSDKLGTGAGRCLQHFKIKTSLSPRTRIARPP